MAPPRIRVERCCPICQRAFTVAPCRLRINPEPCCSRRCKSKRDSQQRKGKTPTWAVAATKRAWNQRMHALLAFQFGVLSERERELFRAVWSQAYRRGWSAGRRSVARKAAA